jgi:epoxyqueuosine reductase
MSGCPLARILACEGCPVTLTAEAIKRRARELGFDACGIAPADDHAELRFLEEWLALGYAASMAYLERSAERRRSVRRVLPSARTVIATATVYNTNHPYSTQETDRGRASIARYAWGEDYHDVIGTRLAALLEWMRRESSVPFEARAYVDTGPVQERVYAQHAGLGWIGKNTCLINPALGSWVFLGEILCSLPLEVDPPALDQCGECTLCLEACPTGALRAPGVLDSNWCISYVTIEHRGDLPGNMRSRLGTHVYGCDICQEVCPWNASPPVSGDPAWQPRAAWLRPRLADLVRMSDEEMASALRKSPMRRAKASGLRRNAIAALSCAEPESEGSSAAAAGQQSAGTREGG